MKLCKKCNNWFTKDNFRKQKASADGLYYWCKNCSKEYYMQQANTKKSIPEHKLCKKCGITKKSKEFCKDPHRKDGLRTYCKDCDNKINRDNFIKNRDKKLAQNRDWGRKNKARKAKKANSPILFNDKTKYRKEIEKYEDVKESHDGYLIIKCLYCGKWFKPSRRQVSNRLNAIYGRSSGELRLYCSKQCKAACPTYWAKEMPKKDKPATSREVQPELRKIVFERDNWTCKHCGKHKDNLPIPIHCHHIDPVINNPIESADVDNCMTLCKNCHIQVHKIPGCGYHELTCARKEGLLPKYCKRIYGDAS